MCDDDERTVLEWFMTLTVEQLETSINSLQLSLDEAEDIMHAGMLELEKEYYRLKEKKDVIYESVKSNGYQYMKAVKAYNNENVLG